MKQELIKLGEIVAAGALLTKPLCKLLEVIQDGCGAIWEPHGIVRRAKAERQAQLIAQVAEQDVIDIVETRALGRVCHSERRRQENIEAVARIAVQQLPDEVSEQHVSGDWAAIFFDACKDVGDVEMRNIWAKLLAGEVAKPGSYSPRTMNALRLLTPDEARAFNRLCSYAWLCDDKEWFIFKRTRIGLDEFGFGYDDLIAVLDAGLVLPRDDTAADFSPGLHYKLSYKGSTHELSVVVNRMVQFPIVPLTNVGKQLAWLSHSPRIEPYYGWCLKSFADGALREASSGNKEESPALSTPHGNSGT